MNILIIENAVSKKEAIETLVVTSGHTPHFALNAKEGLKLLEINEFDMVLTELGMLVISGQSLLGVVMEYLRKRSPITIIASIQDEYTIEHFARLGAVEFLTKPFSVEKLGSICERYKK